MTTPGQTIVTIARAAETLGIGERTIRRWITARLLASYVPKRGVKKAGTRVVVLEQVVALDQRLRQEARTAPRARLRRDYLDALAARQLDSLTPAPNPCDLLEDQREFAGADALEVLSEDPG